MNVLALDLGTRTRWAVSENGRIESGVQVFDVKRGESPGMRFIRFNRWLEDITSAEVAYQARSLPRLIVYEAPHHRGGAATHIAVNLAGRIEEFCARHGIDHQPVHSATLKKWTTGSGRGDKTAMHDAAFRRGWIQVLGDAHGMDDNEVDAICLLHHALAELVPAVR